MSIEHLESLLTSFRIKMDSKDIDNIIDRNKKIRELNDRINSEKRWIEPEYRRALVTGKQPEDGNIYNVFYSDIDGEKRFFIETITGLEGFKLVKEVEKKDAERFARFLLGKSEPELESELESKLEVEIVEKG